jgi:hypothetical protein
MDTRRPAGEVVQGMRTKSEKIRALANAGYECAEIAKYLDIIYQHVRNAGPVRSHRRPAPQDQAEREPVEVEATPRRVRTQPGPFLLIPL